MKEDAPDSSKNPNMSSVAAPVSQRESLHTDARRMPPLARENSSQTGSKDLASTTIVSIGVKKDFF